MKSILTGAAVVVATTCNQTVYDGIYKEIVHEAMRGPANSRQIFEKRNNAIEALRALCHGQLSSYERPPLSQNTPNQHWD